MPMLMIGVGMLVFAAIAADVVHRGWLVRQDVPVAIYIDEHAPMWTILVAAAFSGLGEFRLLLPLALLVGGWLIRRKSWRALFTWGLGLVGSAVINQSLKNAFGIPRPQLHTHFVLGEGYTFPSGHTMGVTITAGLLALLWMHVKPRPAKSRVKMALLVAALGMFEAAALTYIGVHYVTDVLAALGLSLAWLGVLRAILPPARYDPAHESEAPVVAPGREESA